MGWGRVRGMRAGWEKTLQGSERKPVCGSEAEDQTSPAVVRWIKERGWMGKWERCRRDALEQCFGQSSGTRCEKGGWERRERCFELVMASTSIQISEVLRTEPAGLGWSLQGRWMPRTCLCSQPWQGRRGSGSWCCPGSGHCSRPALCTGLTGFYLVPPWESFRANPRLMRAQEQSKA